MVLGQRDPDVASRPAEGQDPMRMAVFPLAVPYLLNPAGIVVLVTEKVFGFLLAALAVQLALNGLSDVGVIHLSSH